MDVKKKDRWKVIRSILEGIFLIVMLIIIIKALFSFKSYQPFKRSEAVSKEGIVAISYFGVDRVGDSTLISTQRLDEHLQALKKQGYVTVTQKDIEDYYEKGTPLPRKALFLMFEDGRRDTSIFAQKLLEDYNYKASAMTYAEKFYKNDPKFLQAEDLKDMQDSTYWEVGTNGYRLSYINVFDRYKHYLGELNTLEFAMISECLGRDYNHYLMDYIRDANGLPKESYTQMKARITADYMGMKEAYQQKLGELPDLYVLMHANTGQFGNNKKVSAVNAENIYELFKMNFNREGDSWNTKTGAEHEIYNLTRMQPQPYWYSNHLLMRIQDDNKQSVQFINGDEEVYKDWNVIEGALECKEEKLVVTSTPSGTGKITLKDSNVKDLELTTNLTGNKLGNQIIYLRTDEQLETGIKVAIKNNVLYVYDNNEEIYQLNLDEFDGVETLSISEDEKAVRIKELEALLRYAESTEEMQSYTEELEALKSLETVSTEEGSPEYVPSISINELGNRELKIRLEGNHLSLWIDGRLVKENIEVKHVTAGLVGLGSSWGGEGWSQRNIADDVYDGVFEKLTIDVLEDGESSLLYDNCLHGFKAVTSKLEEGMNKVINWFIKYL